VIDKEQPVGARVFAAVANYKMFGETKNVRYLERAFNHINFAMSVSSGDEKELNVKPHFDNISKDYEAFAGKFSAFTQNLSVDLRLVDTPLTHKGADELDLRSLDSFDLRKLAK